MPWTRRRFLLSASAAALSIPAGLGAKLGGRGAWAIGPGSRFRIARLKLDGLDEDLRAGATGRLVWEVLKRTSIDGDMDSPAVRLNDPGMFDHPFLALFGDRSFALPGPAELERLRRYLTSGGFLLADSCGGGRGSGFDRSVRQLAAALFPDRELATVPRAHAIYRSFYLLDRPYGRVQTSPQIESVDRDDRSMLVYSQNDLPGAWARDVYGGWAFDVVPGGDRQREMAFRTGVNLVLYALTLNYKRDQVHVRYLLKKLRRRGGAPPDPD